MKLTAEEVYRYQSDSKFRTLVEGIVMHGLSLGVTKIRFVNSY